MMARFRRLSLMLGVLFNIILMVVTVLILGNGESLDDTLVIGESDAQVLFLAALFGVILNIILGMAIWQRQQQLRLVQGRLIELESARSKL